MDFCKCNGNVGLVAPTGNGGHLHGWHMFSVHCWYLYPCTQLKDCKLGTYEKENLAFFLSKRKNTLAIFFVEKKTWLYYLSFLV